MRGRDPVAQHAALLAKVEQFHTSAFEDDYPVLDATEALRRVVQLHEPDLGWWCLGCRFDSADYEHDIAWSKCSTIRAVAEALGVDLNG